MSGRYSGGTMSANDEFAQTLKQIAVRLVNSRHESIAPRHRTRVRQTLRASITFSPRYNFAAAKNRQSRRAPTLVTTDFLYRQTMQLHTCGSHPLRPNAKTRLQYVK